MKQISFRAYIRSTNGDIMIYFDFSNLFNVYKHLKNNAIIMLNTGYKDINNKEIFEGDIVLKGRYKYVIKFDDNGVEPIDIGVRNFYYYGFYLDKINTEGEVERCSLLEWNDRDNVINVVVIGNIYEHPELLQS
jgi:uncharacterized phage protein (TIGR01671 family)